jgi:Copper transport outer membrane protein, MctB
VINFRYHVVSLTAVFLALAIGLVVGTAALNGPVSDALNDRVNGLGKDNKQLREQVSHLEDQANRQDDWATQAAPLLLPNKMTGRRVLLLSLPSGRDYVKGVADMVTLAGATITGHVQMQDRFTDPGRSVDLLDLADEAMPPGVPVADIPHNSYGVETSSALLAAVLMDGAAAPGTGGERRPPPAVPEQPPAVSPTDRAAVLSAYAEESYLSIDDNHKVTGSADAVVVVDGLPYVDREAAARNDAVVTLVAQFDKAGAVVVATPGDSGDGNVVTEVRGDPTLSKTVSTVDNVASPQGTVAAALALALQFSGSGKAGQYGTGAGASSMLPKQDE